jgi:hypothetical protein
MIIRDARCLRSKISTIPTSWKIRAVASGMKWPGRNAVRWGAIAGLGLTLVWGAAAQKAYAQAAGNAAVQPSRNAAPTTDPSGQVDTEMGEIDGAFYRIDKPRNWNHGLVIMSHGYSVDIRKPAAGPPGERLNVFLDEGYAVAQSSWSRGGYALPEALTDNEKLRQFFVKKYGPLKSLYATGGAMGGLVTMMTIERYPQVYTGGLNTCCGPLIPQEVNHQENFELLTLVEYYFPGLFPPVAGPINGYVWDAAQTQRVAAELAKAPEKAEIVRRVAGRKAADLAGYLAYETFVLHEMQERVGGNPFDTTTTVFNVDDDLAKVNEGVKRFAADPKARATMRLVYPAPTGIVKRPLFIMSPIYDATVAVTSTAPYMQVVRDAGYERNVVFQFYNHEGHGAIATGEVKAAFDALQAWVSGSPKPPNGPGVTLPLERRGPGGGRGE